MRSGPHQPVIVEVETRPRLLIPQTRAGLLVRARLRYDARDPYAVHLLVHAEPKPVSWTFARTLLAVGLDRPAGIGDVRVWPSPWATLRGEQVVIALSSPTVTPYWRSPAGCWSRLCAAPKRRCRPARRAPTTIWTLPWPVCWTRPRSVGNGGVHAAGPRCGSCGTTTGAALSTGGLSTAPPNRVWPPAASAATLAP